MEFQRAFILHQRPYRNTSAILEVYAENTGRIGLVARGVRDRKGKGNGLQPFQPLLLSWRTRGELGNLLQFEMDGTPIPLVGRRIYSGLYLNELMYRLLRRQDANPELFALYEWSLRCLIEGREEGVLRLFEKRLLELMGYGLLLEQNAVDDQPVQGSLRYFYHIERGPVPIGAEREQGVPISGKALLALANESFLDPDLMPDMKRLLRAVLGFYLGSKPIRSRELYRIGAAAQEKASE